MLHVRVLFLLLLTKCCFFRYFALLAPIVTFGGLLEEATHQVLNAKKWFLLQKKSISMTKKGF
jgi:hypothetical protein